MVLFTFCPCLIVLLGNVEEELTTSKTSVYFELLLERDKMNSGSYKTTNITEKDNLFL